MKRALGPASFFIGINLIGQPHTRDIIRHRESTISARIILSITEKHVKLICMK